MLPTDFFSHLVAPQTPLRPSTTRSRFVRAACSGLVALAAVAAFSVVARAENWPRFRGPTGQGLSAEKSLPIRWSSDSGVKWRVPIPGTGWSSPIVWGDRVWVTTVTADNTECRLICLDRGTGRVLWNTVVAEIVPLRKEQKNSYASPTPVTDGQVVCVVFGDGTMAAVDLEGQVLWKNQEVRFYSRHGLGASPILHEGRLIMPFDGSNRVEVAGNWPNNSDAEKLGWRTPWDRAEIVALDMATGKRVWTGRRGASRIAHVTPNILREGDQDLLVSCAGDAIQGFNPKDGSLIWTVFSQGEGVTPSFAMGEGLIFTSSGFEATTIRTVRTGGRGDVTSTHIAWEQRKGAPTQPSLLYVAPYLHTITDGGIAYCFQARTGEIVYAERVGGNHCASPIHGAGHIYFLSETGETTVIKDGPTFEIIARNAIDERCQASLAASQGQLFLRSERHLYCLGQ